MQLYDPPDSDRLAEGKTKIIYRGQQPHEVIIRSKDDITAGDGAKRDQIAGKAEASTRTASNVFRLLQGKGILTHYLGPRDELSFLAQQCQMYPVEVVTRRIAFGSFLKRHPDVQPGTVFDKPVIELYLKDDANHDPLMLRSPKIQGWLLFDARQPVGQNAEALRVLGDKDIAAGAYPLDSAVEFAIRRRAQLVFLALEDAWARQGVTLVDLKIEFGRSTKDGQLLLADVITNDEWRIWPGGDVRQMKDKQVYRDLKQLTAEAKQGLTDNYRWVADATHQFLSPSDE